MKDRDPLRLHVTREHAQLTRRSFVLETVGGVLLPYEIDGAASIAFRRHVDQFRSPLDYILHCLADRPAMRKYSVRAVGLRSSQYGGPETRKRVYILGAVCEPATMDCIAHVLTQVRFVGERVLRNRLGCNANCNKVHDHIA